MCITFRNSNHELLILFLIFYCCNHQNNNNKLGNLPRPQGICPLCSDGKKKTLINGICQVHYWRSRTQLLQRRRPVRQVPQSWSIHIPSTKLRWYDEQVRLLTGYCLECGEPIHTFIRAVAFSAVSHILPKNIFKSVQFHPLNWLELGASCGCHGRWGKSWESASKMKVFPQALERFNQFEPDIAAKERSKIPEIFIL